MDPRRRRADWKIRLELEHRLTVSELLARLRDGIFSFWLYVQFTIRGKKGKGAWGQSPIALISAEPFGMPKKLVWLVPLFLLLHLNYWMWDETRVVWGFPVNLLYHVALSLLLSLVMALLVTRGWPRYLDEN